MLMPKSIHEVLSRNLRLLIEHYGISQKELEDKTGVSQRTISNVLRPGSVGSITSDTIEKIADYFQLEYYHLLIPNIPLEELLSKRIEKVVECYAQMPSEGRENVERIAENEVRYSAIIDKKQGNGK
jgi:transcriptional regulator with XRE-family HTH domain